MPRSKRVFPSFLAGLVAGFFAGVLLASDARSDAEVPVGPSPFTTDGCSMSPDSALTGQAHQFLGCCLAHDKAYYQGGTPVEHAQADLTFKDCLKAIGHPEYAKVYHLGVRLGGTPYLPMPFRWGYGWPFGRGYQPTTEAERKAVQESLAAYDCIAGVAKVLVFGRDTVEDLENRLEVSERVCREAGFKTRIPLTPPR
jgi:hypothetical protein